VTARTDADTGLQSSVDDLQAQVTANLDVLNQEIAARGELSSSVAAGYDTINARIDGLAAELSNATSSGQNSVSTLNGQVSSLNSATQVHANQIQQLSGEGVDPEGALASQITALTIIANDALAATETEATTRANADTALESSVDAMGTQVASNTSNLSAESSIRAAADANFDVEIASINTSIAGHTTDIAAETAARVAADTALQTSVDSLNTGLVNTATALSQEITDRTNADTALQTQVTSNSAAVTSHEDEITDLQSDMASAQGKNALVTDVTGYITGYQNIGATIPVSKYLVRDMNNDVRFQNPLYPSKYFPAVSAIAFAAPLSFDADWGGATTNTFHSLDNIDHVRQIKVYSAGSLVANNGSTFIGVDYSTGGSVQRLGQQATTFLCRVTGAVSRFLSLWYRIKSAPTVTNGTWYPAVMADNYTPVMREYERASAEIVIQINVASNQVIEFGIAPLNIQDATMFSITGDSMYGVCASIEAFNLTNVT
jgi:chromosome segregation ATPase